MTSIIVVKTQFVKKILMVQQNVLVHSVTVVIRKLNASEIIASIIVTVSTLTLVKMVIVLILANIQGNVVEKTRNVKL